MSYGLVKLNMFEMGPIELGSQYDLFGKNNGLYRLLPKPLFIMTLPCKYYFFFFCTLRMHLVYGNKNKNEGESQ